MQTGLSTQQLTYLRNDKVLFKNLSLAVKPAHGLLIQGPNGSGKTSLLRLLAGLINPSEGQILWNDQDIQKNRGIYHPILHYMGHLAGVKSKLTVLENLRYSQYIADQTDNEENLMKALQALELHSLQNRLVLRLSAGQKKRLALARLLAFQKELWILDEPFTNLDFSGQAWLNEQIEQQLQNQGMVILASHQTMRFTGKNWTTLVLPHV